jgi:hypothetical protein
MYKETRIYEVHSQHYRRRTVNADVRRSQIISHSTFTLELRIVIKLQSHWMSFGIEFSGIPGGMKSKWRDRPSVYPLE